MVGSIRKPLSILARTWAGLNLLLIALFSFGIGHQAWPTWKGIVSLLLFPGALAGGLLLAWRREALGGALCLGSYGLYGLWRMQMGYGWPLGWALPMLAAPGLLFLCHAFMERGDQSRRIPRTKALTPGP